MPSCLCKILTSIFSTHFPWSFHAVFLLVCHCSTVFTSPFPVFHCNGGLPKKNLYYSTINSTVVNLSAPDHKSSPLWILLEKLYLLSSPKNSCFYYAMWQFDNMFTKTHSHHIITRLAIILYFLLRQGFSSGRFPKFSSQNFIHISSPHACYMPYLPHLSSFNHSNTKKKVQVIKLLIIHFSPFSTHLSLRSKL